MARPTKPILVESGATDNFIHPKLLWQLNLGSQLLERPWKIWNIDGTTNKADVLTRYINLEVCTGDRQEVMKFLVTDLGGEYLILGYPWLSTFEPKFRWRDAAIDTSFLPINIRSVDWRKSWITPVIARIIKGQRLQTKTQRQQEAIFQELERESSLKVISIELSREARRFTQDIEVPEEYRRHARIFDPVESKKLPPSWPWDHTITLKPDALDTLDCKLYPLPPKDDEALKKWLQEEEEKGYIRLSILPITSSFFFLRKANGSQWLSQYNGLWLDPTWVVLGLSSWHRARYCSFCFDSLARLAHWLSSLFQTTLRYLSLSQSGCYEMTRGLLLYGYDSR